MNDNEKLRKKKDAAMGHRTDLIGSERIVIKT
jgi:hypothetical protein